MDGLKHLFDWFSGNGRYMNLVHCMGHDTFWITITVLLDLTVATGYGLIAMHWWKNSRLLPDVPAKRALANMRNIFLFCGICGYIFIPIKMVWPAWRLYDFFMVVLVYFTWRYAWNAKDLKVVYRELGRSTRLAEDLARSQHEVKRKGFFLNALSHDLRTPLNGMVLHVNLAELSLAQQDVAKVRQALEDIKADTRMTAELLDSLLEYARLDTDAEELSFSRFSLDASLRAVVSRFEARARQKGLALRIASSAGPSFHVYTGRLRFERILSNLLDNAIKFTSHGSVTVEVEIPRAGDGVEIHVIDTGVGIDPEAADQLFDEFYQVSNHERDRSKGFGLGLAIARRLAGQLGGDIHVDGALGRGSRFSLVLPGIAASDAVAAGIDQRALAVSGSPAS